MARPRQTAQEAWAKSQSKTFEETAATEVTPESVIREHLERGDDSDMSLVDPSKVVAQVEKEKESRKPDESRGDIDWDITVRSPGRVPSEFKERGTISEARIREKATAHYREHRKAPRIDGIILGMKIATTAEKSSHGFGHGPDLQ